MRRVVLLIGLAAACGEDVGNGPHVAVTMAVAAFKDAQCQHLVKCGEFADVPTCAKYTILTNLAVPVSSEIVAAVLAGKIAYSGSNFAACTAAIASATCDRTDQDSRGVPVVCNQVFRGTVTGGGACTFDTECVSATCNVTCGGSGSCCTGTCVGSTPPVEPALAQIGASCMSKGCVDGSFCNSSDQLCTALRTANMPCNTPSQCAYGLSCYGSTTLTCQPLPGPGEPCPNGQCRDEGQHCKLPAAGGTAVCSPDGLVGASCGFNTDCSPYYRCGATMVCEQLPAIGASCANVGLCADSESTYCNNGTLVCAARLQVGAACTSAQQCASDACSQLTGMCIAPETCI